MFFDGVKGKSRGDRGLDAVAGRRARSIFLVGVLAVGLLATIGFYAGDLWFTYLPLAPILGEAMAWVAAFVTTPIQVAGAALFGNKAQRESFKKEDAYVFYTMFVLFVLANVGDVLSNIWGAHESAVSRGVQLEIFGYIVIVVFSLIMAFTENLAQVMFYIISSHTRTIREASKVLEEAEGKGSTSRGHDFSARRPSSSSHKRAPSSRDRRSSPRTFPER